MDEQMELSIQFAKKYLEDLLSFFGLNTEVHVTSEEDVIELSVPSTHMNGFLIGQHADPGIVSKHFYVRTPQIFSVVIA
jgi:predicted RNA-binding protein Jag